MQGAARRREPSYSPWLTPNAFLTSRSAALRARRLTSELAALWCSQTKGFYTDFIAETSPRPDGWTPELPPAAMAPPPYEAALGARPAARRRPPPAASPQGRTPHLAAASRRGRAARRLHGAGRERGGGPDNMAERCGRTSGGKASAAPGRVTHSPAGCRRRLRAEEGTTRRPRREGTRGGDGRGHRPFAGWSWGRPRPEPPGGSGRRGAALRGGPRGGRGERGRREKGRTVKLLKHIFILQLNN